MSIIPTADPIQNLQVAIQIRKVQGASGRGNEAGAASGVGDTFKRVIGWQEKIMSPGELIIELLDQNRTGSKGTAEERRKRRDVNKAEEEIRADMLENMKEDMLDKFRKSGVWIFTYTDKDTFVPSHDQAPRTSSIANATPLAECMTNLALPLPPAHGRKNSTIQNCGPVGGSSPAPQTLGPAASAIRKRIVRESDFKVMYIMAAVLLDSKKGLTAIRDVNRGALRNVCEEHLLCELKVHRGGVMEVSPGFSEEEPEPDDEGVFRTANTLRLASEMGARLTTFKLRVNASAEGTGRQVFQYTVENVNGFHNVEKIEQDITDEMERDMRAIELRRAGVPASLETTLPNDTKMRLCLRFEVMSASHFDADWLYCHFQALPPPCYTRNYSRTDRINGA